MRDTAAIKKAYAAKLRVTRPDQDAAGYQQLREAFDAAMAYAKAAPAAPAPPRWHETQAPATPAPVESEWHDAVPAAATVKTIDLGDLVNATLDRWEEQGDAALLAHWPELQKILGVSSLTQAIACSTAFAKMVLSEPTLPSEFVDQLRLFFGWGMDYRRTPQLVGHDAVAFKHRLAQLPSQLKTKKVQVEQERINAAKAAAFAIDTAKLLALVTRGRFAYLLRFAKMMAMAPSRIGILFAILMGPILQQQWCGLSANERAILQIDDTAFHQGTAAFEQAARLRRLLGIAVLAIVTGLQSMAAVPAYYALAVLAGLALCHWFPVYQWQESLRARLYPAKFVATWIREEVLGRKHARVFAIAVSLLGLMFCLAIAPPLIGDGARYSTGQAVFAAFLLACLWLFPPDGQDRQPDAIIPVFLFCMVACHAVGITDIVTQMSLAAFWMAMAYSAQNKWWGLIVGVVWAVVVVLIYMQWDFHGREQTLIPLSLIVPWLLFALAPSEGAGFVIFAIALGVLFQPFGNAGAFALWVGTLATVAGWGALLARQRVTRSVSS
jgi:hypothetical protein